MIFDALFDAWDTFESLLPENYSASHNLPYTHGLGAVALESRIQAFIQGGLVWSRTERTPRGEMRWLALSDRGGHLWTLEREPLWDLYCIDASWPSEGGDGSWILSVCSPALQTARAFLECAGRCGLHHVAISQAEMVAKPARQLIPWHTFEAVYELRVPVRDSAPGPVDWAVYERERKWWRSIPELGGLRVSSNDRT